MVMVSRQTELARVLADETEAAGHTARFIDPFSDWASELADRSAGAIVFDLAADPAGCARMSAAMRRSEATGHIRQIAAVQADQLGELDVPATIDELLVHPLAPGELKARLRLLEASRRLSSPTALAFGAVAIDVAAYEVTVNGSPVQLTFKEQELLHFLAAHPDRVFSRSQLLSEVWGYDYFGGTRTVDVHVRRLRFKLGPDIEARIQTVRNVGYKFVAKI